MHDEYLQAFNRPNVHLVDTAPRGIEALTPKGIVHNGKEYPIDVIIWSTGYGSPLTESLAGKAGIAVIGKDGLDMEDEFKEGKLMSLHGLIAHNFPNLFYTGLSQAGVGVNQTQRLDEQSLHIAYTIKEACLRAKSQKTVIEATHTACDDWANQCASKAHMLATMRNCTPSYFNMEGATDRMTPEQQAVAARSALWGQGYLSYAKVLGDWRARGNLEGFEISVA
jgi:cation diffusion facilitator CzcD-associated flavoprotein CzcO